MAPFIARSMAVRPGASGSTTTSEPAMFLRYRGGGRSDQCRPRLYRRRPNAAVWVFDQWRHFFYLSTIGLHVDSHAIAVAPSLPSTVYFGSDGGICKSTNSGVSWTSLNNSQFRDSSWAWLSTRPIASSRSVEHRTTAPTSSGQQAWTRTEGGDGGFTVIDQNAADTSPVTMYHTFFNQTNAMGYSRSLNAGGSWTFFGCGFSGHGQWHDVRGHHILFYAPLEPVRGIRTRSISVPTCFIDRRIGYDGTKVSQEPIRPASRSARSASRPKTMTSGASA